MPMEQKRVWRVRPGRSIIGKGGVVKANGGDILPWDDPDAIAQRASVVPDFAAVEAPKRKTVVDGAGVYSEPKTEKRSGITGWGLGKE